MRSEPGGGSIVRVATMTPHASRASSEDKQLTCYFTDKDDILVHITIYNVPASLVKEFTQKVEYYYCHRSIEPRAKPHQNFTPELHL